MQATLGHIHTSSSTGSAGQDLTYQYNEIGDITAITDALWTGSRSFDYDDLNRLKTASGTFGPGQTPVTNQTYVYDAIGNSLVKGNVSVTTQVVITMMPPTGRYSTPRMCQGKRGKFFFCWTRTRSCCTM